MRVMSTRSLFQPQARAGLRGPVVGMRMGRSSDSLMGHFLRPPGAVMLTKAWRCGKWGGNGSVPLGLVAPPPGALPSWACPPQVSRGGRPGGEGKDGRGQGGVTTVSRPRCCPGEKDVDGSARLQGAPGGS